MKTSRALIRDCKSILRVVSCRYVVSSRRSFPIYRRRFGIVKLSKMLQPEADFRYLGISD
jgi:hypothetical protein